MPQGKPRDPRKEQHWRRLIERWQRSGFSAGAFCRRHRLALSSFYAWRRTLQLRDRQSHESQAPEPVTFLPVHVQHDDAEPQPPLDLVLADGRCLRIPHGFDPAHLRRVLLALGDSPC
ncbi:MAG: IS66 family insertion sequence element accessory protein TnpA [Gemmataceae bacterium]